jgi:murein DD-endopeptidase MepM/ murein hydrolase activator NlpD
MGPPEDDCTRRIAPSSQRRRVWRTALSALAGGGLTAAGLAGLASGASGAETAGTLQTATEEGSIPPPPAPTPTAAGVPQQATEEGSTAGSSHSGTSTTTVPQAVTPAPTKSTPEAKPEAPKVVLPKKAAKKAKPAPTRRTTTTKHGSKAGANANGPAQVVGNNVALAPQVIAAQAGAFAAELANSAASIQALGFYRIPLFLLPIYQAAAAQYGVPWQILAAINEIETNYGADLSVSSAGALGWMQFMPATWLQYGVDALDAGYADPYNPVDAVFSAARYLRAAGAPKDLRAAILAYNHSNAYLESVLLRAKLISSYPKTVIATLTGLTDARPPVSTGLQAVPAASATNGATPLPTNPLGAGSASTLESSTAGSGSAAGSEAPTSGSGSAVSPAAASEAIARTAAGGTISAGGEQGNFIDLITPPDADVLAVQSGRVVKLGSSRALGRFVVLRDVYGDIFTYAGLGSVASTYKPGSSKRADLAWRARLANALASPSESGAPTQAASAGRELPLTLKVSTPNASAALPVLKARPPIASQLASGAGAAPAKGKVRLFAHPGNPDAVAAAARVHGRSSRAGNGRVPLRAGSVVARGTVLGRVRVPHGATAGHLRFAIQPAGDSSTIDPRPIIANWVALEAALHPQGAAKGETDLLGATASGVFLQSKAELQRAVLSDPNVSVPSCAHAAIAAGEIDRRVLAVLEFLSRVGLHPTVSALRCANGTYAAQGAATGSDAGDAVDISAVNGVQIAGHQGAGTIADLTVRALLTLHGAFAPYQIVSLMRYPGASSTLARAERWNAIHIAFRPAARAHVPSPAVLSARLAHSRRGRAATRAPRASAPMLTMLQWDQLVARIGSIPTPKIASRPTSSAIRDTKHR